MPAIKERRQGYCATEPCPVLQVVLDRLDTMESGFNHKLSQLLEARVVAAEVSGGNSEKLKVLSDWKNEHIAEHRTLRGIVYTAAIGSVATVIGLLIKVGLLKLWR